MFSSFLMQLIRWERDRRERTTIGNTCDWRAKCFDNRAIAIRRYSNAIQRVSQLAKSPQNQSINVELATSKLNMLTETWHKFDKAQLSLLKTTADSEIPALTEQYGLAEDTYWRARSSFSARIQALQAMSVQLMTECTLTPTCYDTTWEIWHTRSSCHHSMENSLNGPPFVTSTWLRIRDSVKPTNNASYKMRFPVKHLNGTWAIKGENFAPAWKKLRQAYDDEYQMIRTHIQSMFQVAE